MANGAAYLRLRRRRARRLLEESVEGIEIREQSGDAGTVVVDSETDAWLATLEPCEKAAESDADLAFTPRIRVEYRTDPAGSEKGKLRQIKARLTDAASAWRW